MSCVSWLPREARERKWKAVQKVKGVIADTEEMGMKGWREPSKMQRWRKRGVYPWVSVFPGPVNQSSVLLSLQLHLANEKHRCATLTATPLRAKMRECVWVGALVVVGVAEEHKSPRTRAINHRTCMPSVTHARATKHAESLLLWQQHNAAEVTFTERLASQG